MKKQTIYPLCTFTVFFSSISDVVSKGLDRFEILESDAIDVKQIFDSEFDERIYNAPSRRIIYTPKSKTDITVFATNMVDGADSNIYVLNKLIKGESISFSMSLPDEEYKLYRFNYYRNGESIRYVRSMHDPRWVFYEYGELLSFEDSKFYAQRMIKKRMNREILISYASKLDLDICNEKFWQNIGPFFYIK